MENSPPTRPFAFLRVRREQMPPCCQMSFERQSDGLKAGGVSIIASPLCVLVVREMRRGLQYYT